MKEREDDYAVYIPKRLFDLNSAYRLLCEIAAGNGAVLKVHTGSRSHPGFGNISIVGKQVVFPDTDEFLGIIEVASNFEVYAQTDGNICMNFGFYGIDRLERVAGDRQ